MARMNLFQRKAHERLDEIQSRLQKTREALVRGDALDAADHAGCLENLTSQLRSFTAAWQGDLAERAKARRQPRRSR
jgi:phage shock protein A